MTSRSEPPRLRDYQARALDAAAAAWREGARRVLLVAPTGSGKTVIGAEAVRRALERRQAHGAALWLAHRAELVHQAASALRAAGLRVGVLAASAPADADPDAPAQVASVQTIVAREAPWSRPPCVAVYDEAHHSVSEEWSRVLPPCHAIGLTATPERGDGTGLGALWDRLVTVAQPSELVAAGHIAPVDVVSPPRPMRSRTIAQSPADAWREHTPGEPALCFSANVRMAEQHASEFARAGARVEVVTGDTPATVRAERIAAFDRGALDVLCNVAVLTEGTDTVRASVCIHARSIGTAGLYLQTIGRVRRVSPGKGRAVLLDLAGNVHAHGDPDADRTYSLDGRAIRHAGDDASVRYCRVCGAPIPDDSAACEDCGVAPDVIETRVRACPLMRYERNSSDTHERRVQYLTWLITESRARRWKRGAVQTRYRHRYGSWPSAALMMEAHAHVRRTTTAA